MLAPSGLFPAAPDKVNVVVSANLCAAIVAAFLISSDQFFHWFVIPVFVCGFLISLDALDWFRGRIDLFDPVGIIGVLGLHFFFLAPLLHVHWDYWMLYVSPPPDWRDWLGYMAVINVFGLVLYRLGRSFKPFKTFAGRSSHRKVLVIDRRAFPIVLGILLAVTAALQVYVYTRYGGLLGYITAFETRHVDGGFAGMGWLFMISESFPKLAIIGYAYYAQRVRGLRRWGLIIAVLLTYLALSLLFGGLRGSGSNTVWALFFAVGVLHFWVRPIPKRFIYVGLVFMVLFMYGYGFYKGAGTEALRIFQNPETITQLEAQTGRTLEGALLGDLARSDVQAFLAYRIAGGAGEYEYAWGRTYLGAMTLLIPRTMWPNRPETKVREGTDAQYGMGTFESGQRVSSRVYGLAGETMLNFGLYVVPFVFGLFGLFVSMIRRLLHNWPRYDARVILLPLLVNLSFVVLVSDSDNALFFSIKNMFVIVVLLLGASRFRQVPSKLNGAP